MKQKSGKSGLFALFILGIGCMLFASCGSDDNDDSTIHAMSNTTDEKNIINSVYEADWILDQQVVDHTTISFKDDSLLVSHFPNEQLLDWWMKFSGYGYSGSSDKDSYNVADVNGANLGLSNVGNSNNSSYYETLLVNTNYQIFVDNIHFDVHIETQDNRLTAIKDQINDKWSISWQITKISLLSPATTKVMENTYNPPLSLMLVTTKRIK